MERKKFTLRSGNIPSGFKMMGSSPLHTEPVVEAPVVKTPVERPVGEDAVGSMENPHSMFGQVSDDGKKIVNEKGSWVPLSNTTEFMNVKNRYNKFIASSETN